MSDNTQISQPENLEILMSRRLPPPSHQINTQVELETSRTHNSKKYIQYFLESESRIPKRNRYSSSLPCKSSSKYVDALEHPAGPSILETTADQDEGRAQHATHIQLAEDHLKPFSHPIDGTICLALPLPKGFQTDMNTVLRYESRISRYKKELLGAERNCNELSELFTQIQHNFDAATTQAEWDAQLALLQNANEIAEEMKATRDKLLCNIKHAEKQLSKTTPKIWETMRNAFKEGNILEEDSGDSDSIKLSEDAQQEGEQQFHDQEPELLYHAPYEQQHEPEHTQGNGQAFSESHTLNEAPPFPLDHFGNPRSSYSYPNSTPPAYRAHQTCQTLCQEALTKQSYLKTEIWNARARVQNWNDYDYELELGKFEAGIGEWKSATKTEFDVEMFRLEREAGQRLLRLEAELKQSQREDGVIGVPDADEFLPGFPEDSRDRNIVNQWLANIPPWMLGSSYIHADAMQSPEPRDQDPWDFHPVEHWESQSMLFPFGGEEREKIDEDQVQKEFLENLRKTGKLDLYRWKVGEPNSSQDI